MEAESMKSGLDNFEQALREANHPLMNAKPVLQAIRKHRPLIPDELLKHMKEQVFLSLVSFQIIHKETGSEDQNRMTK